MVTMVTVLLLAVHVPVDIGCLVVVRALEMPLSALRSDGLLYLNL